MTLQQTLVLMALLISSAKTCPGDELSEPWQLIGTHSAVIRMPDGSIQLRGTDRGPTGVLSTKRKTPPAADAILVEASAVCAARSLKFAAFNAETGECVGYWTNPLVVRTETRLTAVLVLSASTESIRVFVGSHGRPAKADVRDIKWTFLRRGMKHSSAVYGARIDAQHSVRQTFRATGGRCGAVTFRIRRAGGFANLPNLSVRLYRWKQDMSTTTQSAPLAESVVPGNQIPGTRQGAVGDVELSATYLDGARELSVPLDADTQRGETLVLELSVEGTDHDGVGFVTFGWIDGYDGGMLFQNNSTHGRDWDLRLETFDVVE